MTGLARSVLDRDWFLPLRELFYPCAAMIAMASITGLLSMAPASGRHWGLEVVRFALAGALAAVLALAVLAVWQRAFGAGSPGPVVRLVTAMMLASVTMVSVLAPAAPSPGNAVGYLAVASVLVIGGVVVWRLGSDVMRNLGAARRTRVELDDAYQETLRVNELLTAAGREWFEIYGAVVVRHVSLPLRDLRKRAPSLGNAEIADAIDHLVDDITRPLAHILHPVATHAGIVASIQQLERGLTPAADEDTRGLDAAGLLLDDAVRLQVYRWVRGLRPSYRGATITITHDAESVAFDAGSFAKGIQLDPVQLLAGLTIDPDGILHAPRRGHDVDVQRAPGLRPAIRTSRWRLLATAPVVSLRLVVIIAFVAVPAPWFATSAALVNVTLTGKGLVGSVAGALVTIVAACLVAALPWSRRGTGGPWWTVAAWCLIGLVSGLSALTVAKLVDPASFAGAASLSIVTRGVFRFALIGVLHQLARGYAAQARSDADEAREQVDEARRIRTTLLKHADETERFVAESLHRTVQGRLSAIALLLRLDRRQEALASLDEVCEVTVTLMEREFSALSPDDPRAVPVLVPLWLGIDLVDRVDWVPIEQLSPELSRDLRRVVDECLVNAARHGAATSMDVSVSHGDGWLSLHCIDNGTGDVAANRIGLGSRLFSEACESHGGRWELLSTGSGAELRLTVDVAALVGGQTGLIR